MMRQRALIVVVSLAALIVGAVGGAALGVELSSRFWYRMSKSLTVASGQQALVVLTLLDKKDEVTLRHLMEMEIDGTLLTLRTMETAERFAPNDPSSDIELAQNYGLSRRSLATALRLIREHENEIRAAWKTHFRR
jgi:hypothetical protein